MHALLVTVQKNVLASALGCWIPALILVLPALGLWGNLGLGVGTSEGGRAGDGELIHNNSFRNMYNYKWAWWEHHSLSISLVLDFPIL